MRTLKDVLAVIQRIMKLDKRFLYARQLFLPDGEVVTSYRALAAAASNDTPATVCVDMESLRVPKVGLKAARPLTSFGSPEASLSARSRLRAAGSFGPPRPIRVGAALAGHLGRALPGLFSRQVIVGCGEPFNKDGVPQHMVLVHMAGNGRGATKGVKRDFAERRVKAAQLKADQARRRKPAPVHLCTCTRLHACTPAPLRRCTAAQLCAAVLLRRCTSASPPLRPVRPLRPLCAFVDRRHRPPAGARRGARHPGSGGKAGAPAQP